MATTKKEKAQKIAPWAAIIVAVLGTVNAYIDSRAAKRKAVNEANEAEADAKEWTEERAQKAWETVREKVNEGARERTDLYYRLQLVERDLDAAIELISAPKPTTGTERRDYEAKLHALKNRVAAGVGKPPKPTKPRPAPLSAWDDVQREERSIPLEMMAKPPSRDGE
jgi:hypothetical protein